MSAIPLSAQAHPKPWGRTASTLPWLKSLDLPACKAEDRIGEVWFGPSAGAGPAGSEGLPAPSNDELLVKILATSEPLSVQVHPDDHQATRWGLPGGKHEAWVVVEAIGDARIALGLKRPVSPAEFRRAASDGSIVNLLHWHPVRVGDVIDVPPGTIHAIGAGLTLIEVQQPVDVTFRLYDYDRGRELHLDAGCEVSQLRPYASALARIDDPRERVVLCDRGPFVLETWRGAGTRHMEIPQGQAVWCVLMEGGARFDGLDAALMTVWRLQGRCVVDLDSGATLVCAYRKDRKDRRWPEVNRPILTTDRSASPRV